MWVGHAGLYLKANNAYKMQKKHITFENNKSLSGQLHTIMAKLKYFSSTKLSINKQDLFSLCACSMLGGPKDKLPCHQVWGILHMCCGHLKGKQTPHTEYPGGWSSISPVVAAWTSISWVPGGRYLVLWYNKLTGGLIGDGQTFKVQRSHTLHILLCQHHIVKWYQRVNTWPW